MRIGNLVFAGLLLPVVLFAQVTWTTHAIYDFNTSWSLCDISVGDFDGDGDADFVAASSNADQLIWWENEGAGVLTPHLFPQTYLGIQKVLAADLDSDGDLDIVASLYNIHELPWWENDGSGNFTYYVIPDLGFIYTLAPCLAVGDLDTDGDQDIVISGSWLENDGSQNFTEHMTLPGGIEDASIVDMDSDGDMDIVCLNSMIYYCWLENNGSEEFTDHEIYETWPDIGADIFPYDMDEDGDIDVIASVTSGFSGVKMFANDGSQVFTSYVIRTGGAYGLRPADVNMDSDTDVLLAVYSGIYCLYNAGAPSFTGQVIDSDYTSAVVVQSADMDGDGDPDVLAGTSNGEIYWCEQIQTHVAVTFSVNMSYQFDLGNFFPDEDGVGIRGDMNGWAGVNGLVDPDEDLIYTTTLALTEGYYEYKFVIWVGNDPNNVIWETSISNRVVEVGGDPVILPVVWFDDNNPNPTNYEITFRVNMDEQVALGVFDPDLDGVIIRGNRNELGMWDGYTPVPRLGESMIYSTEIQFDNLNPGFQLEYKFLIDYDNNQALPVEWEILGGPFDNRLLTPDGTEPDNDMDGYLEISLEPAWFSLAEPTEPANIYVGPYNAPVTVPSGGGAITFDVQLHNNLANPYAGQLWLSLLTPNSVTVNLNPVNVTLPAGQQLFFENVSVSIPGFAPAGMYTVTVNGGLYPGFIAVSDSFLMQKLGTGTSGSAYSWTGIESERIDNVEPETDTFSDLPGRSSLSPAYPNPFNASTSLTVSLPEASELSLVVYDVLGREVATLATGQYSTGNHRFTFETDDLASGLYFIRAVVPGHLDQVRKVMLVR